MIDPLSNILSRLSALRCHERQVFFWPRGSNVPEYERIRESVDRAFDRLIVRASGVRRSDKGTVTMGSVSVDEKSYALRWAESAKRIDRIGMSYSVGRDVAALRKRDSHFRRALDRRLANGRRSGSVRPEIEWHKLDVLPRLLVAGWIEWDNPLQNFPALCLFKSKALADLIRHALQLRDGDNALNIRIRQTVSEYGLVRLRSGKRISSVTFDGGSVLFR